MPHPEEDATMAKPRLKTRGKAAPEAAVEARGISKTVMDSAQQIWLAGLGAFAKAQEEGSKLFEALVKEGTALDAKTRKFTEAKMNEARGNVESTLGQVRERSQETWDKLEKVFEARVSKALGRLGVPGNTELQALSARVDALSREVKKLGGKPAAAKRPVAKRAAK
jgi:poly(hydroxyalkanoate) granule-associated protein